MILLLGLSGNFLSKMGLFKVHCIFQVKKGEKPCIFKNVIIFFRFTGDDPFFSFLTPQIYIVSSRGASQLGGSLLGIPPGYKANKL